MQAAIFKERGVAVHLGRRELDRELRRGHGATEMRREAEI